MNCNAVVEAANHGLSKNTWKSYKTAKNHIARVEKECRVKLRMPFGIKEFLVYVGYLLEHRKVKGNTIEQYLSGIRMAHLNAGYFSPCLKPDIIKLVISGACNRDALKAKLLGKGNRVAITIDHLKIIKNNIKVRKNWTLSKKRLVWLVCVWAFTGSFRIHELLSRSSDNFDPTQTLLSNDVKLKR